MTSTTSDCWCFSQPQVGPVGPASEDCMCPGCLSEAVAQLSGNESGRELRSQPLVQQSLVEGEDFYLEGTAMVFTAQFLLKRGYCCESGCRNCPY